MNSLLQISPWLAGRSTVVLFTILCLLFFTCQVNGAELFRKQTGTATIAAGSTSVTVTIPAVCLTQSFLVFSASTDDDQPGDLHIGGRMTNATTLTFSRFGNNLSSAATIKWQVFEFEGSVTVQRGTTNLTASPTDIPITTIDLTKTFVIATMTNDGGTTGTSDGFTADLTSTTNLRLSAAGTGANFVVYWQVIQYQDAVVKKLSTALAAGTASTTATITPAITTLSKAFVISNHTIGAAINADDLPRTVLTNATTVTYTRGVGTVGAMNFVTYVVEFTDLTTVVRGTQAFASGSVIQNVAVTATASTGLFGPGNQGRQGSTSFATSDNLGHVWFNFELTSLTNLAITRAVGTGSTANAPYQLVTFEDQNTSPRTYYSFATGAWESNTSWSFSSDGSTGAVGVGVYPRRSDNVVIRTGHNITINSVTDNGLCGLSPANLSRTNVGPFTSSGSLMFYHTGDVLIASGGTLSVTVKIMLEGYTLVENGGTFTISDDIVNLGYLEVSPTATFTNTDDFVLSGNSITIINSTAFGADDIYIDWTNATLCGDGVMNLGNGGPDPTVQFFNGATIAQICSNFTLTCTSNCGAFPITPTGNFSVGNTGPGGVATTDGTSELKVWLDASTSVFSNAGTTPSGDGGVVQQWNDRSGSANHATKTTSGQPTYDAVDPAINNAAAIDFTAASSNRFNINTFTLNPATSSFSIISALNVGPTTAANQNIVQQKDASGTGRTLLLYNNATAKLTSFLGNVTTAPTATYTLSTWTISSQTFNFNGATTAINLFKAGTADGSATVTPETTVGSWLIGSDKFESGAFLNGSMGELVILNQSLNNAKRIIIENYLSAKYNIPLTANDVYLMDDAGNGNFDNEVAGIGQASNGSSHRDARGSGVVRLWNPGNLGNGEFLMWGHNNTPITSSTTISPADVDGTIIQERLSRIWRAGETGDVGTTSISFDFSGIGSPLGSNLRLLIDRDGDGFGDNDVTPIVGSVSNGIAVFSGVNFQNGDRFTLGNTDASIPLPIELISFSAIAHQAEVKLQWSTASELNNDFFTVQRSQDAEGWEDVTIVKGAGNSTQRIDYETTDGLPFSGVSYYRLKQTDFDGRYTYSGLRRVEVTQAFQLKVYPNPTSGSFRIVTGFEILPGDVKLNNTLGQNIPIKLRAEGSLVTVDSGYITPGIYILQVTRGYWRQSVRIVVE